MGHNQSVDSTIEAVQDDILRHARILSEIGALSYEEFLKCLSELNTLSRKCLDPDGKQLVFAVKKGTDSTVLWKGTVRIACVKVDPISRKIDNYKLFNLSQFLRVFRTLQNHLVVMKEVEKNEEDHFIASTSCNSQNSNASDYLTASQLMSKVELAVGNSLKSEHQPGESLNECCICLERKPDVMLPCAHSYCLPCIEQWNVNNKTCPICRETVASTDDSWVLSEAPEAYEINEEICAALMGLSKNSK